MTSIVKASKTRLYATLVLATCCFTPPFVASAHKHHKPDVNILFAPQTEHWPSNYIPDNYVLKNYDGKPDENTQCSGQTGYTLSTTKRPCPAGQKPIKQKHTWSTSTP